MADQLRNDFLGRGFTPHIDSLRKEGVTFSRAYCASPLCVPARGAFFTGLYPNNNGSLINPWRKSDESSGYVKHGTPNLYGLLEKEYDSVNAGKQHFLTQDMIDKDKNSKTKWTHGIEDYFNHIRQKGVPSPGGVAFRMLVPEMQNGTYTHVQPYSSPHTGCWEHDFDDFFDGYFLNGAIDAIKNRDKSKPFLLNAMFLAPHPPFDIPEKWYKMYSREQIIPSENVAKWYQGQSPLQIYNLTGAVGTAFSYDDYCEAWRVYAGLVTLLDDCVGKIIKELKHQNIYDDTLILFTSDHGEMLGSHFCFQKMCMFEESAHIPLIIKFPKEDQIKAKTIHENVSHVDVLPTLLSYLGKEPLEKADGIDLMPLIKGDVETLARKGIFIQFDGNGALGNFQRCVIAGDQKLILERFSNEVYASLYDLKKDPFEKINLALDEKYHEDLHHHIDSINQFMSETDDMLPIFDHQFIDRTMSHYR